MNKIFTIDNPMPPPWLMYPELPLGSMGWRMGYGEDYSIRYYDWLKKLPEKEKSLYNNLFPEPKMWCSDHFRKAGDMNGIAFWSITGEPIYNIGDLMSDYQDRKKFEYIFFWGHQPKKDGTVSRACFSNWWLSPFKVSIANYCCVEQFMMSYKASLFKDQDINTHILETNDPATIKKLGRAVHNFDEKVWNEYKYSIMLNALYAKFMQNTELKKFLLATETAILVEASPYDKIWGIGLKQDESEVTNPLKWRGENLLGFALMEVRKEIRRICKNERMISWKVIDEKFEGSRSREALEY